MIQENDPKFVVQQEIVATGLAALDPIAKDYLIGGAETEATILRNRAAIERRALRPRVLVDVSQLNLETQIIKRMARLPIFLAPIGALHRFHPNGNTAAGTAADKMRLPMFFGGLSQQALADMRATTTHDAVYQLYIRGDAKQVDEQVRQVEELGFDALCITVDSAVYSRRERDMLRRFKKPWRKEFTPSAMNHQAAFTWQDVSRIRRDCSLPIILKGIASPEDAQLAVDHGVDVVYVSNHGGRQLDQAQGTLDVLSEIKTAVSPPTKLFIDGGFMRGTDIVKALALGADAVGIGRLYCFALAAAGEAGVVRMLQILKEELETALALVGASSTSTLCHSHVVAEPYLISHPHLLSAFPLLNKPQTT
ncbi:MAG: alpha-hydroxy acid oxidase [Chloroflexota bacterium]